MALRVALLVLAVSVLVYHGVIRRPPNERPITVSATTLRSLAMVAPTPAFPEPSVRARVEGVAVAHVVVSTNGHPITATVLEAPDARIGRAVAQAISGWKFKTLDYGGRTQRFAAKLVFYFVVREGAGLVLTPAEMERHHLTLRTPSSPGHAGTR
jgi:TonB family protein